MQLAMLRDKPPTHIKYVSVDSNSVRDLTDKAVKVHKVPVAGLFPQKSH